MTGTIIVSAPSKVLITGGYVVLERPNTGLVLGLTARVYSIVQPGSKQVASQPSTPVPITLVSPQYQSTFRYAFRPGGGAKAFTREDDNLNPFAQTVLRHVLSVIYETIPKEDFHTLTKNGLSIHILGDNSYYSQRRQLESHNPPLPLCRESLEKLPPFLTFKDPSNQPKTGLGSSAALVTSLVGALLQYFNIISLAPPDTDDEQIARYFGIPSRTLLHNLAQVTHCLAQGKIGSGFDVCAAVYGTQKYMRFSPDVIAGITQESGPDQVMECIVRESGRASPTDNLSWDEQVAPLDLPECFHLLLGDVCGGAHTPSMVSALLKWRKDKPDEANPLWNTMCRTNTEITELLAELTAASHINPKKFTDTANQASQGGMTPTKWRESSDTVLQAFGRVHALYQELRKAVQHVSACCKVPVEPEHFADLLDRTAAIPGVIMSGCPGAGGEDAVFALAISDVAKDAVCKMWAKYNQGYNGENRVIDGVCVLPVDNDHAGAIQVTELPKGHPIPAPAL